MKGFINKGEYNPKTLRILYKSLAFKISEIDDRLMNAFPDLNEKGAFFNFDKIKRKVQE
jgi:hypothetical protein